MPYPIERVPMKNKRVLVIRCGALGDLVYATSIIDALKNEYGEETLIDFLLTPGTSALFNKDPRVNRVFPLKHKKLPLLFNKDKRRIVRYSRRAPYDILVNLESGHVFQSLVHAIHAKKKFGIFSETVHCPPQFRHMADYIRCTFKNSVSDAVFNNAFPRLIGEDAEAMRSKFALPPDYIVVSPSNSHQKKKGLNYRAWPTPNWKQLIDTLSKSRNIVVIGAKNEEDFFRDLRPFPKGVVDLVGQTSLPELIGVIEAGRALIATDTGTAHMASALNTEVFALIGPTPAESTGPYQSPHNKVHIISAHLPCSPCYKTQAMRDCTDNICMKAITVETVVETLESQLNRNKMA